MTSESILIGIIVLLFGVVIGGTGGQALIRRAIGTNGSVDKEVAVAASAAASAAATAAASLNQHVERIQESVDKQWDTLDEIGKQQTRLATAFEQFPEVCKLKHEGVDRELKQMQSEIDIVNTKV